MEILGRCDLRCPFCWGPRHEKPDTNIPALLNLIRSFPEYGVESIVITGGEPALIKDLPEVLRTAKEECKLKTVLSTNGLRFAKRLDEIAPFLDWVALPLDAATLEVNRKMRVGDPRQFQIVQDLIPLIRDRYPRLGIKLGTVVCKINKHDILPMIDLIKERCKPDVWKLYQVSYSVYAEDNREQLELSDEEFDDLYKRVNILAGQYNIVLAAYTRAERDGKHLFFTPEGNAMVIAQGQETLIGNFYEDINRVARIWSEFVRTDRLVTNFDRTYPIKRSQPLAKSH